MDFCDVGGADRLVIGLGGRREKRAEANVVGVLVDRRFRLRRAVRGEPDEFSRASKSSRLGHGDVVLADVDSVGPGGFDEFRVVDHMLSIRAMPKSAADTRLVDVSRAGSRLLRVRAGKIDAVLDAERAVKAILS